MLHLISFHCSFGNWFHTYQLVHFLFAATELLHDWKGQESNVLEGTKDWSIGSLWAQRSWRSYYLYWTWMFWPLEADTWREQGHWWIEVPHYLLWHYWYGDFLSSHFCAFKWKIKIILLLIVAWFLQASLSFWGPITCFL